MAVEARAPAPGHDRRARRAAAIRSDAVIPDVIAVPANEHVAARRAACVLEAADAARQVAGIDVPQAVRAADRRGVDQHARSRVRRIGHLVIGVKRGDVPRNVRRHAGDERREPLELVAGIVESRNQQRDDLDPEIHRVQPANRVEDRLQPSAKLTVMAIVEALEIDFVQIDPRAQIFEHFRRAVAVRHVSRRQPRGLGLLEDGHGPLARDERLIVRAHHHARVQPKRILNEPFRRRLQRRRNGSRIAERLRRHPVLAVPAVQIASKHPEAVRERAGLRVKEWLLLDGITLNAAHIAPGHEQTSAFVEPHLADANRALRQRTAVAARVAAQPAVRQPLVQFAFARLVREHLSQCGHGLLHCIAASGLCASARDRGSQRSGWYAH